MKVALSDIKNTQPKRDQGDISELKASIRKVGLINPLTIDENFNLIAGRRRYQAITELGWTEVEVYTLPVNGDRLKAFKIAIDENLKRKPLTDPEVATAIKEYDELERKLEGENKGGQRTDLGHNVTEVAGWSYQKTAEELGISKPAVVKAVKIAEIVEKYPDLAALQKGSLILRKAADLDRRAELQQSPRAVGKKTDMLPLQALWPNVRSALLNQADRAVLRLRDLRQSCCINENAIKQGVTAFPPAAAAIAKMQEALRVAEGLITAAAAELQRVAVSSRTEPIPRTTGEAQVHNFHFSKRSVAKVAVINASYIGAKAGERIYNLGAEKIAQYHRLRGDEVYAGPWVPTMLENREVHKFYFSVIFSWDIPEMIRQVNLVKDWGREAEIGGPAATFMHKYIHKHTGIEPHRGPDERFERIPGNYQLTFTSRGCPHNCQFCGVKKVEPEALEYDDFAIAPMIGDNNILATSFKHQELVVNKYANFNGKVDVNSGFDVRFFLKEHFKLYSRLRLKYWRFAWDTMEVEEDVRRVAAMMRSNGLDRHQVTFYCLIGFPGQTPEECLYRLNTLIELGMNPYPMRFWPLNSLDRKYVAPDWTEALLQRMTSYYRTPPLWNTFPWENYRPGKKT